MRVLANGQLLPDVVRAFGCGGAYRTWGDAVEARILEREPDGGGGGRDRLPDVGQVFVGAGEHCERPCGVGRSLLATTRMRSGQRLSGW